MGATVDSDGVEMRLLHRFPNDATRRDGHLRWNLTRIGEEVEGALARVPETASIGIDTWGVDYGLLDREGRLLDEPVSYRDDRTAEVVASVHAAVGPEELYRMTGVQFLPFNTLYQLAAEKVGPLWDRAARAVLLPDLLAYWLTGELRSEATVASTTGLVDVATGGWCRPLLDRLGIPTDLFPPLEPPGGLRGRTATGRAVVTVGSHDTASAVVAVPATTEDFAYISCGTWSIVGLELDAPVVTEQARRANFSNERGVDGRVRFLRNTGGLWFLQECLRWWGRTDLERLLEQAALLPAGGPVFDVDDPSLIPPGGMPARVASAAGEPMDPVATVRCILDSLARGLAAALRQACALTGSRVDVLHLVGGGAHNDLLCRLVATETGLPLVAGPVEATALGNVLVQARFAGTAPDSLDGLRRLVARSTPLRRYQPT